MNFLICLIASCTTDDSLNRFCIVWQIAFLNFPNPCWPHSNLRFYSLMVLFFHHFDYSIYNGCSAVLTAHASKTCTFFSTTLEPNYCPKRKTKNKNYDFGKFCLNLWFFFTFYLCNCDLLYVLPTFVRSSPSHKNCVLYASTSL